MIGAVRDPDNLAAFERMLRSDRDEALNTRELRLLQVLNVERRGGDQARIARAEAFELLCRAEIARRRRLRGLIGV